MSLRSRLILIMVSLLAVGLAGAAIGTFGAVRASETERARQLLSELGRDAAAVIAGATDPAQALAGLTNESGSAPLWRSLARSGSAPGLYEIRSASGEIQHSAAFEPVPGVPDHLAPAAVTEENPDGEVFYRTRDAQDGWRDQNWLVRAAWLPGGQGVLVVGMRMTEHDETIRQLAAYEIVGALVALAAVASLAWLLIHRSMRPLDRIAATAAAIGAGDLTRRVEQPSDRTEVGRLAAALNAMLGQIESAFRHRQDTEERLRRFIADASHELRTPVTTVRGYAELFRRGAASRPVDLRTSMERIEAEAARMGALVDELLVLAQLDQGRAPEHGPVDLALLAGEAAAAAGAVEPDRPIVVAAPGEAVVLGDAAQLRQVLDNLLANTRRHTPPGTPVEVRVVPDGGAVVVEVADHGPGLAADERDRVFERFYRSDASRSRGHGGAGLGLSIVAAIAAAHGGSADVRPTPGGGATFRVRLPVAPVVE